MRFVILAMLSMLGAIPALADEAVTIKLKLHAKPGTMQTHSELSKDSGSIKFLDGDGNLQKEIKPNGSETIARDTILKADKDGKPTQFLRAYDKATDTEDGKTKTYSYQGKTLLFEKDKDGKFRVGVVGKGEIDREEGEKLVRNANKPSDSEAILEQLDPKKPVKVGDSWQLDPKRFAQAQDVKIDEKKSKMTAKLKGVTRKGTFGVFEIDIRLSIMELKEPIQLTFEPGAELTMKGTVELAIDGSSTESTSKFVASMKGDANAPTGGEKGSLTFEITGEVTDHESAEKDAPDWGKVPEVTWLAAVGAWSTFKPKDASFQIEFPGTPQEKTKKGEGFIETQYSSGVDGGVVVYSVAITEFEDPSKINPPAVLKAAVASLKNVKSQKEIKVNGHAGAEIVYEQEAGGFKFDVTRQIIMVNSRAFEVSTVAMKGKQADTEKFLKSLQILEKAKKTDD